MAGLKQRADAIYAHGSTAIAPWGQRLSVVLVVAALAGCASLEQSLAPDPQLAQPGGGAAGTPSDPPQPSQRDSANSGQSGTTSSADTGSKSQKDPSVTGDSTTDSAAPQPPEEGDRPPLIAQSFPDLLETPADLREQVLAVAQLGVLTLTTTDIPEELQTLNGAESTPETGDADSDAASEPQDTETTEGSDSETRSSNPGEPPTSSQNPFITEAGELLFAPNQRVTRRQYARWLVAANNTFYGDRPSLKLRLAAASSTPVFKDVKANDPDFAVIQGLAEAGIIPSALSGAQQQVNFKPDKPLSREDLLLWKLPLDVRGALPTSSLEAVKEAWGFQDASKISTPAQRAVLADYQNGDRAVTRRVFGYTTLFQPAKPVTRAEAAAALAYFGSQDELIAADEVDAEPTVQNPETIGG